jgi:hypothetical protein
MRSSALRFGFHASLAACLASIAFNVVLGCRCARLHLPRLSTLFAGFALDVKERWLRRFLFANAFITPLIALVYFYPRFSIPLLLLGTPWLVTVPGALWLLTLHFRRGLTAPPSITTTWVSS